jgi:8-oxo-dGTP pyrophosphatase MutT (NUDIX family)
VLLITSREARRWLIPKGWGKKGEPATSAAAREALEETGVAGVLLATPIGHYRYRKQVKSGELQRVKVAVYSLEVVHEHEDWPERALRERLWTTPAEAAALVEEPELQMLIAGFAPEAGG